MEIDTNDQKKIKNVTRLVFVGSPLLDISVATDKEMLRKYELKADDCIKASPKHDELFRNLFNRSDSKLAAGGSAQNAARIAKWVLGQNGDVGFAGCAGCDDYEAWMRVKLSSESVLPLYVKNPKVGTGVCACLLSRNGDRSMCCRQGAAAEFSTQHLKIEPIRSYLDKAHCVFVEGYFLTHSPDVVRALAANCSSNQIFSLSLSAEYVCRMHADLLEEILPRVHVLMGNEAEVKTLASKLDNREQITIDEAIQALWRLQTSMTSSPKILIVTRGSRPVMVVDGSNVVRHFDVPTNVPVVDSVGCGDAMAGAFLATYSATRNVDISVRVGIQAAGEILQIRGCDPPLEKKCCFEESPYDTNSILNS